jgi:hypothetical protein
MFGIFKKRKEEVFILSATINVNKKLQEVQNKGYRICGDIYITRDINSDYERVVCIPLKRYIKD